MAGSAGVVLLLAFVLAATGTVRRLLPVWLSKKWSPLLRKKQVLALSLTLVVCILFSHLSHAFFSATRQTSVQRAATALPYFFPLSMNRFLDKMGIRARDEIDGLYDEASASDIAYPLHPMAVEEFIPNYNILFIAIDSWNPRAFDQTTTPNIYRMASQYHSFSNHNSSSNATRGSLFGIFFGISSTYRVDGQHRHYYHRRPWSGI